MRHPFITGIVRIQKTVDTLEVPTRANMKELSNIIEKEENISNNSSIENKKKYEITIPIESEMEYNYSKESPKKSEIFLKTNTVFSVYENEINFNSNFQRDEIPKLTINSAMGDSIDEGVCPHQTSREYKFKINSMIKN